MTVIVEPHRPIGWRRTLLGIGFGLFAGAIVLTLAATGTLKGVPAVLLLGLIWIAFPSAERLSLRLALNGAIGLGAIPVLWWFSWPTFGRVGHSGVIEGVLVGAIVACALVHRRGPRVLIPKTSRLDWLPLGALAFCAWFFLPFFKFRSGVPAVAMLIQGFGGDNVAHFDIFEMIRKYGVAGPLWPAPRDGTIYAYVPYPQHFHVLVAFAAELWHGPALGSVDTEAGLFGLGTAFVLSVAFVTLIAAVSSVAVFRAHFGLALVSCLAAVAFLFLGFGANSLAYGFPGFLLAVIGTLVVVVLASRGAPTSLAELAAGGSLVVLVAHSWSLLDPIAAVGLLFLLARLPWSLQRRKVAWLVGVGVISIATLLGVLWAVILVLRATKTAGTPAEALSTPGAVASVSLPLTIVIAIALIAVSLDWIAAARRVGVTRTAPLPALMVAGVTVVSLIEMEILVFVQLQQAGELSYFQTKFIGGVSMVLWVLFVLIGSMRIAGVLAAGTVVSSPRRMLAAVAFASVAIVLTAGLPTLASSSLNDVNDPGLAFRFTLEQAAQNPMITTVERLRAAAVMRTFPCARPLFVDPAAGGYMSESNQWAMSLSTTWTEGASKPTSYIFANRNQRSSAGIAHTINALLAGHYDRCVVVSPSEKKKLDPKILPTYRARLYTWSS